MSSEVRSFLAHTAQIGVLIAFMIGGVFFGIPVDSSHYFTGSLRQVELLEKINGPRIILVGGSNVAFGFDASLMQEEIGIPVINDGLHAGLGILPVKELEQYIRKGDIIILSLEYSMFVSEDAMNGDPVFLADWIEYSPSRVRYLSDPMGEVLPIYGIMLQRKVNRVLDASLRGGNLGEARRIFNSKNFNSNGDFIGHLNEPSEIFGKIPPDPYTVFPLQDEIFIFLDEFNQYARSRGAIVYFEAPASRKINCDATGETKLANFFREYSERSPIPLLTNPEQICLPNKYFFDTVYHLNSDGREVKTRNLINNLLAIHLEAINR